MIFSKYTYSWRSNRFTDDMEIDEYGTGYARTTIVCGINTYKSGIIRNGVGVLHMLVLNLFIYQLLAFGKPGL